jgi:glutamate-ammonia-ligase adenylyltransferase
MPVRGLCAIAMGKLGSREVGYGSDLDVIFVYDPALRPDDPLAYFSRSARRIIQLLTMPHGAGRGYELDTRLRPSGSQGLLVTSLAAFGRYHRLPAGDDDGVPHADRAATWERLALLKARVSAGDTALGRAALQVAHDAAYGSPIDVTQAARSVHELRLRMERELARERPGRYDVKFGRGGLLDVDFCVQLLQLRHGAHERVRTPQTQRAIEELANLGALDPRQAAWLREGREFLLRLEQRLRIVHGDGSHLIEAEAVGLKALARRMGLRDRPAQEATAALLERYRQVTGRIRSCYDEIVVRAAQN